MPPSDRQEEVRIMNPQVPDELISAYFDGEVTPEERTAVERLLAENEEIQRELNETARLSALLHSFPRESAPSELADSILRETNQLPTPQAATAATVTPSRYLWVQLRAALVSAATTAAVCLIVIRAYDGPAPGSAESLALKKAAPAARTSDLAMNEALSSNAPDSRLKKQDAPQEFASADRPAFQEERPSDLKAAPFGAQRDSADEMKKQVIPYSDKRSGTETENLMRARTDGDSRAKGGNDSGPDAGGVAEGTGGPQKPGSVGVAAPASADAAPALTDGSRQFTAKKAMGGPRAGAAVAPAPAPAGVPFAAPPRAAAPAGPAMPREPVVVDNYSSVPGLSNGDFLSELNKGNVITFVPQPADPESNVAVVELEVVDIERGAETIQVLLQKSQIKPRSNEERNAAKSRSSADPDNDLVVVYAVAPGDRLAQILQDVDRHPDLFPNGWSSQPTLNMVDNDVLARADSKSSDSQPSPKSDAAAAKPGDGRKEALAERAEAQQVVDALVMRNSTLQKGNGANPTIAGTKDVEGESVTNFQRGGISESSDKDQRGRGSSRKLAEASGYEVIRVQNPGLAVPTTNPMMQNRYAGLEPLPGNRRATAPIQGNAVAQEKAPQGNAGGRSLRMLFLLHSAQTDNQVRNPAKKAAP